MNAVALCLCHNTLDLADIMRRQVPGVLIVDNGSYPPIPGAWLRKDQNLRFSGGWNAAMLQLDAQRPDVDYAWMLNSDVGGVSTSMLEKLVSIAYENDLVAVTPRSPCSVWPQMKSEVYTETEFIDWCAPLVKVEWFLNSGGFDESLPGWGSDIDLCYRQRHKKMAVAGELAIVHAYGGTARRTGPNGMYDAPGSRQILLDKHGPEIAKWLPKYFKLP